MYLDVLERTLDFEAVGRFRVLEIELVAVDVGSEVAAGWVDLRVDEGDEKREKDEETHFDGSKGWISCL